MKVFILIWFILSCLCMLYTWVKSVNWIFKKLKIEDKIYKIINKLK